MNRVLLDTNVYGDIIEKNHLGIVERYMSSATDKGLVIYGSVIIRKELRAVPKSSRQAKQARIAFLRLYDLLVGKHSIEANKLITGLAEDYLRVFKELKNQPMKKKFVSEEMYDDF